MKHVKLFEQFLNETTVRNFRPTVINRKNALDEKFFKKLMPRTANTTDEAMERIWMFEGGTMFEHYQYHVVKPNGNKPDRPTYRIHQVQCWLNDGYKQQIQNLGLDPNAGVNVTLLTIFELKKGEDINTSQGDAWAWVGQIYVDTKAFLDELNVVFEVIKRAQ
jgi:hypothetical protein